MVKLHTALKHLHLRPIAYYPVYAHLMGSVAGGVVLSQILYWAARSEGEFFKTDDELARETGCSFKEVRAAKEKLRSLPFIRVEVRGLPARTYYQVDWDALVECLASVVVDDVEEVSEQPETAEEANKFAQNGQTSLPNLGKLECLNQANLNAQIGQTIYNKDSETTTEITTETTTENIVQSSTGAEAQMSEVSSPTGKGKKPRTLTLRIETPPKPKPGKPDYYREVAEAFREVVGDDSDPLAIRACLRAWKQVREGGNGVRGLPAEEIVSLWRRARERASPEWRERITLLWVLDNGEKARRLASYEPPPDPNRVIDETPEVLRILAERRKLWQEGGERCST